MTTTNGHANGSRIPASEEDKLRRYEELVSNFWTCRSELFKAFFANHQDIDNEVGWLPDGELKGEFYRNMFDRMAIARRVVEVYPQECWQVAPMVYEDENARNATQFEKAWDALGSNLMLNGKSWYMDEAGSLIWSYLLRADIMSGIGRFGVILLGIDDGKLLEEPADGAPPDGVPKDISGVSDLTSKDIYGGQLPKALEQPLASTMGTDAQYFGVQFTPMQPKTTKRDGAQLLFMRVFDETLVEVVQYEASMYNARFGLPIMYRITLNDPRQPHSGIGLPLATVRVHWSRVIHIADNLQSSEIFGAPRMRPVVNNILDLRKLYGGSAEMYWRGAFPGLSIETNPQMGGDAILDLPSLRGMMTDYHTGLQRWISLLGMQAKSLAPQVVDPTPQITVQLQAICIYLGIPLRVFMGSERGELASSQDDAKWNDRLHHRQHFYVTPRVICPFIDRLILLGILPEPAKKPTRNANGRFNPADRFIRNAAGKITGVRTPRGYCIEWPDLDSTTKKDKAAIALQTTQAIAAYVQGNVASVVPEQDYLTRILGLDEEEADAILAEAENKQAEEDKENEALADKHGFEPAPPPGFSKPPPPPPAFGTKPGKGIAATQPGGGGGSPKTKAEQSSQTQQQKQLKQPAPAANVHHTPEHDTAFDEDAEADDGRKEAHDLMEDEKERYAKLREDVDDDYRPRHVAPIDVQRKQKAGEIPYGTEDVADPPRPKVVRNASGFWLGLAEAFLEQAL